MLKLVLYLINVLTEFLKSDWGSRTLPSSQNALTNITAKFPFNLVPQWFFLFSLNQNQIKQHINWITCTLSYCLQEILQDQQKVQSLVRWSDIAVRAVDGFAGERVSMRVSILVLWRILLSQSCSRSTRLASFLGDSIPPQSLCICVRFSLKTWFGLVCLQVDLECEDGKKAIGIFSHKMLSV